MATLCVCVLDSQPYLTVWNPMDCTPPGSSVPGISQAEYWSGLPFPSPGNLPDPGIEPGSLALQADFLPYEPLGKPTRQVKKTNAHLYYTSRKY